MTALERYTEMCIEPDTPLENLRAFCSFAMNGQDWLDVEQFFVALEAEKKEQALEYLSLFTQCTEALNERDALKAKLDAAVTVETLVRWRDRVNTLACLSLKADRRDVAIGLKTEMRDAIDAMKEPRA